MARAEQAAGALGESQGAVGHLDLRVCFAAQLAHGLDHLRDAAAIGRMVVAQPATVGIERQRADARDQVAVGTKRPPSPFLQKPRSSSCISTVMVKLS